MSNNTFNINITPNFDAEAIRQSAEEAAASFLTAFADSILAARDAIEGFADAVAELDETLADEEPAHYFEFTGTYTFEHGDLVQVSDDPCYHGYLAREYRDELTEHMAGKVVKINSTPDGYGDYQVKDPESGESSWINKDHLAPAPLRVGDAVRVRSNPKYHSPSLDAERPAAALPEGRGGEGYKVTSLEDSIASGNVVVNGLVVLPEYVQRVA